MSLSIPLNTASGTPEPQPNGISARPDLTIEGFGTVNQTDTESNPLVDQRASQAVYFFDYSELGTPISLELTGSLAEVAVCLFEHVSTEGRVNVIVKDPASTATATICLKVTTVTQALDMVLKVNGGYNSGYNGSHKFSGYYHGI